MNTKIYKSNYFKNKKIYKKILQIKTVENNTHFKEKLLQHFSFITVQFWVIDIYLFTVRIGLSNKYSFAITQLCIRLEFHSFTKINWLGLKWKYKGWLIKVIENKVLSTTLGNVQQLVGKSKYLPKSVHKICSFPNKCVLSFDNVPIFTVIILFWWKSGLDWLCKLHRELLEYWPTYSGKKPKNCNAIKITIYIV